MKFADKEASEELYKLLKETGIEVPESEFSWYKFNGATYKKPLTETEASYIAINEFGGLQGCLKHRLYPAYSFDEVWNMLPCLIGIEGIGGFDLHICKTNLYTFCSYYDFIRQLDIFDHRKQYKNNNPTQAASELLIWVIKSHRGAFIKHTGKLGL